MCGHLELARVLSKGADHTVRVPTSRTIKEQRADMGGLGKPIRLRSEEL